MTDSLATFASFAGELADAARRVTIPAASAMQEVENKNESGPFDPVTEADRETERAMRLMIEARYPDHGIAGEELGEKASAGRYVWSFDPIDGTRSYICGLPNWTTLIALLDDGVPVIGLIDAPMLGERYLASEGTGRLITAAAETSLAVSGCRMLGEARLTTTDPYLFEGDEAVAFERLRKRVRVSRFGQDGYGYARLAAGGIDLVVEAGLKPHDIHALVPVIEAAGGVIGNWGGGPDLTSGQVAAAATPQLYAEAVQLLRDR